MEPKAFGAEYLTRERLRGSVRHLTPITEYRRKAVAEALEGRLLLSGYTLSTLTSFVPAPNGQNPFGLISDASGNLFGTTARGGPGDGGTVFEMLSQPLHGSPHPMANQLTVNSPLGWS
jgi:hypothetical protein